MSTKQLREFLDRLARLAEAHRAGFDHDGADRLEGLLSRGREFADELDEVLSRLGNPPTDRR